MTHSKVHRSDPRLDLLLERVGRCPEVIENEKLVWTTALGPGHRPSRASSEVPPFTAVITLEAHGTGTKYSALAIHGDEGDCKTHADVGFHEGWGKALDQLVAAVTAL